jgi:hypothetical protein
MADTKDVGLKMLHKLLFVAVALISISTDARAAINVERAEYRAGILVVVGRTAKPHQTVTLDGRRSREITHSVSRSSTGDIGFVSPIVHIR